MDTPFINNTTSSGSAISDKAFPKTGTTTGTAAQPVTPPAVPEAVVQQPASVPSMKQVAQAVEEINKAMQSMSQSLEFSVDSDTDQTIVTVRDLNTDKIVRQMPSKEAIALAKELGKAVDKTQQGLLLNQKA